MANTPASILVLASDPLMRDILQETLEQAGYVVVTADEIGAAVDRLKEIQPDLLIIRPYIASMPAPEAVNYLRTIRVGLPVLIVDGLMDDERIRVRDAVENYHVFPQPFAAADLLNRVREVLQGARP